MLIKLLTLIVRLIENLVFNTNRIIYGSLILISVFLSYFFKLENFLITLIFFLTIYDLKKSLFLNKFTLLISFFIFLSMLIFYNILSPYYLSLLNIILFVVSFISVIIFKKYLKIYFIINIFFLIFYNDC